MGRLSDPKILAIPVFLATVAGEAWMLRATPAGADGSALRNKAGYEPRDTATSLTMGVGNLVIGALVAGTLHRFDEKLRARRIIDVGTGPAAWLIAMVGWDLLYYCEHRMSHRVRLYWANHVTHHSSQHYNLSTALRQPWQGYMAHWVYAPLPLIGVRPGMNMTVGSLNLLYQYWIHTETVDRMPAWFEALFNTPSHHRAHHGADQQYLDKNYAGILIIWDRLFGTFEPEVEPVTYGLTKNINSFNPLTVAYHESAAIVSDVIAAKSWRERLRKVFGPPGS